MTTTRSQPAEVSLRTTAGPPDASDLHVLRLALELQVDAMLLTIGAAARAADDAEVPWRRWAVEDLDAARLLARTLIAHDAEPPVALGSGSVGGAADDALDHLIARYSSMDDLLSGVLLRPHAGQAWRPVARDSQERCRARLDELHRHRGTAAVRRGRRDPRYLPGELLG